MSLADIYFIETCKEILENGTSTENQKVRPHWPDGTPAYTKKIFGVVHRYNLQKEFPAITLRKTGLKSCMDEILWIYQKKSNNINDLSTHIWDQWADKNGSIGKAYGCQIGRKFCHHIINKDSDWIADDIKEEQIKYGLSISPPDYLRIYKSTGEYDLWNKLDQMDAVLYDLKVNPFSRRILTTLWNPDDLVYMGLQPCAWSVTYNVTEKDGELYLNMFLNQRSQDMLAANNWNTAQYAILLMMVAQVSGMKPGELIHSIVDCHIYDRHIPIIKELISRPTYDAPEVWLDPYIKNFYDFTTDNLHVSNYIAGEQVKFEVAI